MTTSAQDDRRVPTKAKVEHPTVAERVARGQAARADVPRSAHAEFDPGPERPDPIALLEGQAETRVPELVPIRYGRMLVSPFTFYRGAALIMASDLATTPTTDLRAQLCGDAHLSNFGVFGTPERRMVFDVNDFDETLPGPVRVGPQAPGGQPRGGRPRPGLRRRRARGRGAGRRGQLPQRHGRLRRPGATCEIFYARLDVDEAFARYQATVPAQAAQARRKAARQGAHQGQHAGARRSSPTRSTASRASAPTRR